MAVTRPLPLTVTPEVVPGEELTVARVVVIEVVPEPLRSPEIEIDSLPVM